MGPRRRYGILAHFGRIMRVYRSLKVKPKNYYYYYFKYYVLLLFKYSVIEFIFWYYFCSNFDI